MCENVSLSGPVSERFRPVLRAFSSRGYSLGCLRFIRQLLLFLPVFGKNVRVNRGFTVGFEKF